MQMVNLKADTVDVDKLRQSTVTVNEWDKLKEYV
jgi:hypothetical protein